MLEVFLDTGINYTVIHSVSLNNIYARHFSERVEINVILCTTLGYHSFKILHSHYLMKVLQTYLLTDTVKLSYILWNSIDTAVSLKYISQIV